MKRSSNFELLRIVAMLMIIAGHIIVHVVVQGFDGTDCFSYPFFYKKVGMLSVATLLGPIANGIFLIISGYFLASKEPKRLNVSKTAIKLLTQLGFASILLIVFSLAFYLKDTSFYSGLIGIDTFNSNSWFVGYYFLVIFFGKLFMNAFLTNIEKKQYLELLIILFGISQFSWSNALVNGFSNGMSTLLIGVFFYSIGGYIKKYDPFSSLRTYVVIGLPILCFLAMYANSFIVTSVNIQTFLATGNTENFVQTIPQFGNSNILVVISSIAIFELFRRLNIPQNSIINYLGAGTFMVYLIHDNNFFYSLWEKTDWLMILNTSVLWFVRNWILWIGLTFFVGIICYTVYNALNYFLLKIKFLFLCDK